MAIGIQTKKQIRALMQDPRWPALELAFTEYLKDNFLDHSAKQATEWDTMWYVAHNEGGKYHIKAFFNQLENEVNNLE
ncbi:MAG: hypothetical protein WC735_04840 [Candidatus Paceibacterota bacterium]|jgi:hypothetical protein